MPGLMGTGHKDTPDVPAEALQPPELGGATRTPKAHLQPPPATLPETVKQKRIGYPLSDAQIL